MKLFSVAIVACGPMMPKGELTSSLSAALAATEIHNHLFLGAYKAEHEDEAVGKAVRRYREGQQAATIQQIGVIEIPVDVPEVKE